MRPADIDNVEDADVYVDEFDEGVEEYYDEDSEEELYEEPTGLFSTPARTLTVIGSLVLLLMVGLVVAWLLGAQAKKPATTNITAPRVGALAPDIELVDVNTNQPVKLSALRGKPVFINFWGTWCPPCRAEMPEMQKLYNDLKGEVEFIGVSAGPRDSPDLVKNFVKQYNYTWTFIHDPNSESLLTYRVGGIPSSYFIDKDGVIRGIHVGQADTNIFQTNLKKIHQ
jgi:thiol-disulfide isomerase/thioredoxin